MSFYEKLIKTHNGNKVKPPHQSLGSSQELLVSSCLCDQKNLYSWKLKSSHLLRFFYLITGSPLKAKVEVKTRSSKPVVKDYELPIQFWSVKTQAWVKEEHED